MRYSSYHPILSVIPEPSYFLALELSILQSNSLKPPEMVHLTSPQPDVKSIWNVLVSLSPQQY